MSDQRSEFDLVVERARRAQAARAALDVRQSSPVFRARLRLASLVLGKRNWRVIYRHNVALAAARPNLVDRLLAEHSGRKGPTDG